MKRKIFSKLLMVAMLIASVSAFVSCKDYDDDINNVRSLIDQNTKLIEQIKSQITAGAVITGVTTTSDGLAITLSNGQTYNVKNGTNGTNGKDGKDGVDGKDGKDGVDGKNAIAWTIGEDGYWYMDGVKTDYYALGKDGKDGAPGKDGKDGVDGKDGKDGAGVDGKDGKDGANGKDGVDGKDGKDGANGKDGVDGKDGKDGIPGQYYVPNAETGYFDVYAWDETKGEYVKDEAASGKVSYTSPTALTATLGKDALTLKNVETADGLQDFTIYLSSRVKSLVFAGDLLGKDGEIKRAYVDGVPAVRVSWFNFSELKNYAGADGKHPTLNTKSELWTMQFDKDGNLVMTDTINAPVYAYYHVNPSNAKVDDLKELSYVIKANADYYKTRAGVEASSDFNVTPEFISFENGILTVKLTTEGTPAYSTDIESETVGRRTPISVFALQAKPVDADTTVTSDYITMLKRDVENLIISDNSNVLDEKGKTFLNEGAAGNDDAWIDYHFRQGDNVNFVEAWTTADVYNGFTINSSPQKVSGVYYTAWDAINKKHWGDVAENDCRKYRAGTNRWAVWDEYTYSFEEGNDSTVDFKLAYDEVHNLYNYVTVHSATAIYGATNRDLIYGREDGLHLNECFGDDDNLLEALGLELKFEIVQNYKLPYDMSTTGVNIKTDQAQFISLDEDGNIHAQVNGKDFENPTAAIGRTPIIRVKLVQKETGKIVRVSYVKIQWIKKAPKDAEITINLEGVKWNCDGAWDSTTVAKINEEIYQYMQMSKEEFHSTYKYFQDNAVAGDNAGSNKVQDYILGNLNESNAHYSDRYDRISEESLADVDNWKNQAEIVSNTTGGNSTYMIYWNVPADTLWKYAGQEIHNIVTFSTGSDGQNATGRKLVVKLVTNVEGIQKAYNLTTPDYRPDYWRNNYAFTEFNVNIPNFNSQLKEDSCLYKNNLNHPFITNDNGVILLGDADDPLDVAKMYYYFCDDMEDGEKTIGNTKVTFKILDNKTTDPDTLLAKKSGDIWSVIGYITNNAVNNPVKISEQKTVNGTTTAKDIWNLFEYNKYAFAAHTTPWTDQAEGGFSTIGTLKVTEDPTLAKELLNTADMNVLIGAKAILCNPESDKYTVDVTFNGEDHFQANILKPVYGESGEGEIYDGVNFPYNPSAPAKKSYIKLEDMVKFYEWRYLYDEAKKEEYKFGFPTYGKKGGTGDDQNKIVVKTNGTWHWTYYGLCSHEYDKVWSGAAWANRAKAGDSFQAFEIDIDLKNIKCNINGPGTKVNLPAGLYVGFVSDVTGAIDPSGTGVTEGTTAAPNVTLVDPANDETVTGDPATVYTNYGVLTYHNTGNKLQNDIELYVPIIVKYGWGEFTVIVTVPVKKTANA